jgi:tetratricopeptide (TPR) repeat protein
MTKLEEYYSKAVNSWRSGNLVDALDFFKKIQKKNPRNSEIISYIGVLELQLGDIDKGISSLKFAIDISPGDSKIKANLANAYIDKFHYLLKNNYFDEALESLKESINVFPTNEIAYLNLLKLLIKLKKFNEVDNCFNSLEKLNPNNAEIFYLYGNALFDQKKYIEALHQYDKAISIKQDFYECVFHQALCLEFTGNFKKSLVKYDQCIKINPNYNLALLNKSQLLLKMGDYVQGWHIYKTRWLTAMENEHYLLNKDNELNNREDLSKKIFIWPEQGIGDQILFSSLLNDFNNIAKDLTLSIDKRLVSLFQRSFPKIKIISKEEAQFFDDYDKHLPIGNLGLFVRNHISKFKNQKKQFLFPDEIKRNHFLSTFNNKKEILCGFSVTSKNHRYGESKSIDLKLFAKNLKRYNFKYINLDYENNNLELENAKNKYGLNIFDTVNIDKFNDIESLVALISCCQLVITVSNVTAHLAGSLGIKTILLAPYGYGKFWYWSDKEFSKWYPSVQIIHQKNHSGWEDTLDQLNSKIAINF